jgi:2-keto-4-pentenoate hydratase/2-oxohepta-3-ene-1,7-dioic acid hydratase in catechol pathway
LKIVVHGNDERVGALVGDNLIDLNRTDTKIPASLASFLDGGQANLDAAQRAIDTASEAPDGAVVKLSATSLRAPWAKRRIAMVAANYPRHVGGVMRGVKVDLGQIERQMRDHGQFGFWKVALPVLGPNDDLPYPANSTHLDYEGEVAIVIGKEATNIKASQINDYVAGVTIVNDWSRRDVMDPPSLLSYNFMKNFTASTSIGPAITIGEIADIQDVDIETKVNGDVRQDYNTNEMVFSFAEVLEHLSRDFTFLPGDIIAGGTGAGTAADATPRTDEKAPMTSLAQDLFLHRGDVVEITSPKIGTLRNKIV